MKTIYYTEYSDDRIEWFPLFSSFYLLHCVEEARKQPYPWRIKTAELINAQDADEEKIQESIKTPNLLERLYQ